MKIKNILLALAIVCSIAAFSACNDESAEISPINAQNNYMTTYTGGDEIEGDTTDF